MNKPIKQSKKNSTIKTAIDYFFILIGTALLTLSVYAFTAANNIAPGGVTGLATAIHYIIPQLPIGTIVSIINIPLIIVGYRFLGKRFIVKTLVSTVAFSVLYDYVFTLFVPIYVGDKMLASLYGGLLSGIGLAVVFLRGGSTGGTDITNRIIQNKYPHISLGRIVLLSDVVVILFATFVFGEIESAMYAIVAMFVASKAMDTLLYGGDICKTVMIVTKMPNKVCSAVAGSIDRGSTILSAKGGYTGEEKAVIMCVCKANQFYKLKKLVYQIDPDAFMTVTESTEVVGRGFKDLASTM